MWNVLGLAGLSEDDWVPHSTTGNDLSNLMMVAKEYSIKVIDSPGSR